MWHRISICSLLIFTIKKSTPTLRQGTYHLKLHSKRIDTPLGFTRTNTGALASEEILCPPPSVCIISSNPGLGPLIGLPASNVGKFVSCGSSERLNVILEDIFVMLSSAEQSLLRRHIPTKETANKIFMVHPHF